MLTISPYLVIDNAFTDPEFALDMARQLEYKPPTKSDNWKGVRTNEIRSDYIYPVINKVFIKEDVPTYTFRYRLRYYGHILYEDLRPREQDWWHRDPNNCVFAGVIYLNEEPEPDSGTEIKLPSGENIIVDNKFNRLVIYNSGLFHRPRGGYGNNINNGRLTFTFFISSVNFNFEREE